MVGKPGSVQREVVKAQYLKIIFVRAVALLIELYQQLGQHGFINVAVELNVGAGLGQIKFGVVGTALKTGFFIVFIQLYLEIRQTGGAPAVIIAGSHASV